MHQGILLQSQNRIDVSFFACSILHNMILKADVLDKKWEEHIEWDILKILFFLMRNSTKMKYLSNLSVISKLERVAQYESSVEVEYEDNEVEEKKQEC